jgi:hypothetical protein
MFTEEVLVLRVGQSRVYLESKSYESHNGHPRLYMMVAVTPFTTDYPNLYSKMIALFFRNMIHDIVLLSILLYEPREWNLSSS